MVDLNSSRPDCCEPAHPIIWLAAFLLAALRSLPFWLALTLDPPGAVQLPVGYIPKDWLTYTGLIRHFGDGAPFLVNPFTTEPQAGRFLLPYHQFLGAIHYATGADPFWLVELSRWPTTFLMIWALWRFLGTVMPRPDHRKMAVWAVAFAGGFDAMVRPLASLAPAPLSEWIRQDLWHLYGWSTFEAAYNPLWTLGLAGLLIIGASLFPPGGPRTARDKVVVGVSFPILWFTHVYSALAIPALVVGIVAVEWAAEGRAPTARIARTALTLAPGGVIIGAVTAWQLEDPVFRASSSGLIGSQAPSVFWFPVTFGALGVLAVVGYREMDSKSRRVGRVLAGWFLGGAWLASCPLLNGYHFVFVLSLPLAVLATPVLAARLSSAQQRRSSRVGTAALIVALFASPLAVTATSLSEVEPYGTVPAEVMAILKDLADRPPGNVLAPPPVGNLVPAYTPHRVWVGHWFLTPDYRLRSRVFEEVTGPGDDKGRLVGLVEANAIRYVVTPLAGADRVAQRLSARVSDFVTHGSLVLLVLTDPAAPPGGGPHRLPHSQPSSSRILP